MKLNRQDVTARRDALILEDGEHRASLAGISKVSKPSGRFLALDFKTQGGKEVVLFVLMEPAASRQDLTAMALEQQTLLLDFFQAALGTDEVEDVAEALSEATGVEVAMTTKRKRSRAEVTAFAAVPAPVPTGRK